jgi:hypothetical protein
VLLLSGERRYPELPLASRGPNGRIPNEMRPELNPAVLKASVEIWRDQRPNAKLRSITGSYNCIGMVIACRRTWVDPEHLLRVLVEDGYSKLNGEAQAHLGDLVAYRDEKGEICHAGIVVGKNVYNPDSPRDALIVLSKWGHEGEYVHDASDVPLQCGKPAEFWTDRKGT